MRVLDSIVIPTRRSGRRTPMNWKMSKRPRARRVMAAIGLAAALLVTSGRAVRAESGPPPTPNGLEGTWLVQVTLRNCTTNAALASFNSIVTFHAGGTISETTSSPGFAVGQRSPGHGQWVPERHHRFSQRMISLINFDTAANLPGTPGFDPSLPVTPGFFAGWATVTHTLRLSDADHVESSGTNAFYKADGTVYRTGCSTALSERF
jgi:hypothetical protein